MKSFTKILLPFVAALGFGLTAGAEVPSGYYSSCEGRTGKSLLTSLHDVIGNHTVLSYSELWTLYRTSDVYDNGKIWDMYSTKEWTYKSDQCGSYSVVGDCYNREHSFPKSWFDDASPMYTDAFHIYPTDGKVNGQRSNYPFGECDGGTTLPPANGAKALGKLGKSTFPGYSGTVFEPDDQYKGDFARSYFYMAACYNDKISGWDSDMLAGNSYPAFSSWAVDLLLKWHREDPVSSKELNRNEAVADAQDNRNPFIDHPELAEYIWGDKNGSAWYSSSTGKAELLLPVDGTTLDMGTTMPGVVRTANLIVKGLNLSENVSLSVSGSAFGVSPASIAASEASTADGEMVSVTFNPDGEGDYTGVLTVASGNLKSEVSLKGRSIASIPAGPVNSLSDCSFVATWTFVGDADAAGEYTLDVRQNGVSLDAYPCSVKASDESYLVEDLEASTTYTYIVKSNNLSSAEISVKTLAPQPSIAIVYNGVMPLVAATGEASEAIELSIFAENISSPIAISVDAPFSVSTDKASWTQSINLDPEEDRFYLQLQSAVAGSFRSALTASVGEYVNDEFVVEGIVADVVGFFEDFEVVDAAADTYGGHVYQGTAAIWNMTDAGIWASDKPYDGSQAVRMGKTASSCVEMAENYRSGFATVSLWAALFGKDSAAEFVLEYTTDGNNWLSAGSGKVETTAYAEYVFTVNVAEPARIRVRQTSGKRFMIDNIEASAPTGSVADLTDGLDGWDAFCRDGEIVVQAQTAVDVRIYALDGIEIFGATVASGETIIPAAKGLYIVSVNSASRRVLVK